MKRTGANRERHLIEFLMHAGKLKQLQRQGWKMRGIAPVESVASHSYRTALLAALLAKDCNANAEKAVKMALLHDLPEAIVGDVAMRVDESRQAISSKEKFKREENALQGMTAGLPLEMRRELLELWHEFEHGKSREAAFVKQLDRLELALQALEYELQGAKPGLLQEFFDYADARIKEPELREIFLEILKMRQSRQKI